MDAPGAQPRERQEGSPAGQIAWVAAILLAVFVAWKMGPYAGGADSSGYFNSARLLAQGKVAVPLPSLPGHAPAEFGDGAFHPLGFSVLQDRTRMQPTYPTGLPLHLVALAWLTGWASAATIVNALAAGAVVLLTRRLCLEAGADEWAAAGATLAVATSPLLVFCALQPMSDLLATAWVLAALLAGLRGREDSRWAAFAGAAVGVAVLVRPSNALLVVPVAFALGANWRRLAAAAAGGLPAAVFFLGYNRLAYGHPLATGYGDQVSSSFGLAFLRANLPHMARWVPLLLTPLVLAAVAAPFRRTGRGRVHVALWLWVAALGLFYGLYFHTGESWWYLRFILPLFPALAALAAAALSPIHAPAWRRGAALALLVVVAVWQWEGGRRLDVLGVPEHERNYPRAAEWARQHLPANSVVFCMQVSGAIYYYTDLLIARWDQTYRERIPVLLAAARAQQRPVYAALQGFEEEPARRVIPGQWVKVGESGPTNFWEIRAER